MDGEWTAKPPDVDEALHPHTGFVGLWGPIRNPRLIELSFAEAHLAGLGVGTKAGRTSGGQPVGHEAAEKWVTRLRARAPTR